jgi:hypothetical protein
VRSLARCKQSVALVHPIPTSSLDAETVATALTPPPWIVTITAASTAWLRPDA